MDLPSRTIHRTTEPLNLETRSWESKPISHLDLETDEDNSALEPRTTLYASRHTTHRLGKAPAHNTNDGSEETALPSRNALFRKEGQSGWGGDTRDDSIYRSKEEQCSGAYQIDGAKLAEICRAQRECYAQHKIVDSKMLDVHRLRSSMRDKRTEENGLRVSIMDRLNEVSCCECKGALRVIYEDYEALQLLVRRYLDLEYGYRIQEDELEEYENLFNRSAAKLCSIIRSSLDINPFPDIESLETALLKSTSEGSEHRKLPCNAPEKKGNKPRLQTQLYVPDSQSRDALGGWKQDDPIPTTEMAIRTGRPESTLQWLKARVDTYQDLLHLDLDNHHLKEVVHSNVAKDPPPILGDLAQFEQSEHPLKLPPEAAFQPFYIGECMTPHEKLLFVNCWILHQIRTSSLECARFSSQPEWQIMRDQGLNELDISRLALGYWFKDDTVIPRTLNPSIAFSKHQEKRNPISRRPSYHRRQLSLRKRTRSMASAHGPMPTLRRMSRHDTDWNKVLPEEAADKRKSQRKW